MVLTFCPNISQDALCSSWKRETLNACDWHRRIFRATLLNAEGMGVEGRKTSKISEMDYIPSSGESNFPRTAFNAAEPVISSYMHQFG